MIKYKIRGSFICNRCRAKCPSGQECDAGDDFPRKQKISCLGKYCDDPCDLQGAGDVTMDQLINLIKYLGTELNTLIYEKNKI